MTQNLERVATPIDTTPVAPPATGEPAPPPTTTSGPASWGRRGFWLLPIVAILGAYLIHQDPPYLSLNPANTRLELQYPAQYWLLAAHVAAGTVTLVTVVLQLWPWLRRTHPGIHRWSGRLFVFGGAVPTALLAIIMLPHSYPAGRIGAAVAAVLLAATALLGWLRAKQHRYAEHRRWMFYSFAIVWGFAVWGFAIGQAWVWWAPWQVSFDPVIEASRWVGWVINLAIAQWWLERTAGRPLDLPANVTARA
jgi:hypothetical protein